MTPPPPRRSRAMSLSADWDNVFGKRKDIQRHPAFTQREKPLKTFVTGSKYVGNWNGIGMAGFGTYIFPHGVEYEGNLEDGQFDGDGTLQYPMGQKIDGKWEKGSLVSWKYRFFDGLEYEVPWGYCIFPDRRFHLCIDEGLRPAGRELTTDDYIARTIPEGCYDTGDGFYDPKIKCVVSAYDPKQVIRIPTAAEEKWIMENCRKAWDEPTGYRPDLYRQWTTGRADEVIEEEVEEDSKGDEDDDPDPEVSNISIKFSESWATYQVD